MIRVTLPRSILLSILLLACTEEHHEGMVSHPCFSNGTCNDGLTCITWSTWSKNDGRWITTYKYTPAKTEGLEEASASICADTKTMKISDIRKGQ